MINAQQAQKVIAGPLMGSGGGKLGTVQAVLANSSTGTPQWLVVALGTGGEEHRFLPADQATLSGHVLSVPYTHGVFDDAPDVDPQHDQPSPDEAAELYRHYGITQPI